MMLNHVSLFHNICLDGVYVLRVFVESSSIESLRQHTPWRNRPKRFFSTESLADSSFDEQRQRLDSMSSVTNVLDLSLAAIGERSDGDWDAALMDHLSALRLESFRDFLVGQGLSTPAALDSRLASLTSLRALERFAANYTGPDRDRLLANLALASRVVSRESDHASGRIPAVLYLHGIGDTVRF